MPLRKIDGGRAADDLDDESEPLPVIEEHDPVSQKQASNKPSNHVTLLIAELRGRTEGLHGAELEVEIERFLGRLIDYQAKAAPDGPLREEIRRTLRGMVESDPYVGALVRELRDAPEG